MNTHTYKSQENKSQSVSAATPQLQSSSESTFQFVDNRPEVVAQRKLQELANNSPQVKQAAQLQAMANKYSAQQKYPIQKKEKNTGLPDNLKSGIENLSGYSMDDVKVYYNSDKPAQLQAHAYAQGTDIHLGSGQEKHLPHEAWHVVQQKQGRVKPTMQMKKVNINDDVELEQEADLMGAKAMLNASQEGKSNSTIQRKNLVKQLAYAGTLQRAAIPNTKYDTSNTEANKSLIEGLSVTKLIGFWKVVYVEDAKNAMEWRLDICDLILDKLAQKNYGDYDRDILTAVSTEEVNAALLKKTPLGAGEIKFLASIDVGGRAIVAARMQKMSDALLINEVSMIQILSLLGVRVPTLYGAVDDNGGEIIQLPKDAQGKLNMLMAKIISPLQPLIVYDMGQKELASKLTGFLEHNHGNDQEKFQLMKTNMLRDLAVLRDVYQVLAICDLEILIEDGTGHICTIDPGAIVPAGMAADKAKEINTRRNLTHSYTQVADFQYTEQAQNPYPISSKNAMYIGGFCKQAKHSATEDLLIRIHKVLKNEEVEFVKDVTVTESEVRGVIEKNAKLEELGELVEENDIVLAIERLRDIESNPKDFFT